MNRQSYNGNGYSADVRMQLNVNGHAFRVGQLGPDFVILDNPIDHPPAEGEMTMSIDGDVTRWTVWLPDGLSAGKQFCPTQLPK